MKIELAPIGQLVLYASNPRNNEKAVDKVAASIQEFGFRQPIVIDEKFTIIAGHTRYLAAQKLGLKEVPVHVADGLTAAQVKAYRLADNRVAQEATWDDSLLAAELEGLKELEFDLNLTGFNPDELDKLLHVEQILGNMDEDAVPDLPLEPRSKPGDLWILGEHRVLCGDASIFDSVDKLMDGNKADMVFTDPPYNLASENTLTSADIRKGYADLKSSGWDKNFVIDDALNNLLLSLNKDVSVYICTAHHLAGSIWEWYKTWASHYGFCVWHKTNPMPSLYKRHWISACELICYGTSNKHTFNYPTEGHAENVWSFNAGKHDTGHPTQKPVQLSEHAILHSSKPRDLVLDLFGGSGSTLIACEKNKRVCYTMELDPKYVDVIVKRWQDFTGKKAALESTGEIFDENN